MENAQFLAERIKKIAKIKKVSISKMLEDCKLNKNTLFSMQNRGCYPRLEPLVKIADYLDCSLDYLLNRENFSSINDIKNVVQQEQIHNSTITISQSNSDENTEIEEEILRILKKLSTKEKAEIFLKICEYEK